MILVGVSSSSGYAGLVKIKHALECLNVICGYIKSPSNSSNAVISFLNSISVSGHVSATNFVNNSEEGLKTNIKKLSTKKKKVLDIIKNTDICEFNYKKQNEKTIGLVIGDKYNYPEEIIKTQKDSQGNVTKGVDLYSMCSLGWQGIKEAQEENVKLQERIEKLEKIIEGNKA